MAERDVKTEHLALSQNLRHWSTLRFADPKIHTGITVAVMEVIFATDVSFPGLVRRAIRITGVLVSIFFLVVHERNMASRVLFSDARPSWRRS